MKSNAKNRLERVEKRLAIIGEHHQRSELSGPRVAGIPLLIAQSRYVLYLNQFMENELFSTKKRRKLREKIIRIGHAMKREIESQHNQDSTGFDEVADAFRCIDNLSNMS